MSTALERIQVLEEKIQFLIEKMSRPDPIVQMLMNKAVGFEQTLAQLGKTIAAISEELTETGVLNSVNVVVRLRKSEDEASIQNIKTLLKEGVIETSDVIDMGSIAAVEQSVLNTETNESTVISSYYVLGMNSHTTDPSWRDALLGKKIGESATRFESGNEKEILTVKEVYKLKEREVQGEEESFLDQPESQ